MPPPRHVLLIDVDTVDGGHVATWSDVDNGNDEQWEENMRAIWGSCAMAMVVCAANVSMVNAAEKAEDAKEPQARAVVELRDGSRILGRTELQAIKVKAAYAELTMPLGEIRSLVPSDDGGTVAVLLANGDKITGTPKTGAVKVITAFGEFDIALKHMVRAQFSMHKGGEADATEGLVAWYRFDNPANLGEDSSGWNHHGANRGAVYQEIGVKDGGAVFDGVDDGIQVSNYPSLNSEQLSFSLWVKGDASMDGRYGRVMGKIESNTCAGWEFYLSTHAGWRFCPQYLQDAVFVPVPYAGQWIHLAATFDGTSAKLYTNGVFAAEHAISASHIIVCNGPLWIGTYAAAGWTYFKGSIDDVKIWSRPLSADEIAREARR